MQLWCQGFGEKMDFIFKLLEKDPWYYSVEKVREEDPREGTQEDKTGTEQERNIVPSSILCLQSLSPLRARVRRRDALVTVDTYVRGPGHFLPETRMPIGG